MLPVKRISELLRQLPRPPEHGIPTGVSGSICDEFTERTGIAIPESVREWLSISNGPCVGPGGMFGIHPAQRGLDIEQCLKVFPSWQDKKWIPVAGDGCGNHYIVPTQQEFGIGFPVLFMDNATSSDIPSYIVASDFGRFLVSLFERELGKKGWPFDKNVVLLNDPHITRYRNVGLPWATQG